MAKAIAADKRAAEVIVRFNVRQRVEHVLLMLTFIVLALTGIVQRFSTVGVSQSIIMGLGGIESVRVIHRAFAVLLTLGVAYHLVYLTLVFFVGHARLSMMPTLQDFRDVIAEIRHRLGQGTAAPRFDRYDYRQKFEYMGLMFGSAILVVTGFILAYPVAVTQFLPGQVVAAAVVFHGNEATLAILTIIIWHLYDVMFRQRVFPADTSIFTGRISRERMVEEHPLEYERLAASADGGARPAKEVV